MKKDEKKKLHEKGLKELQGLLSKLKNELADIKIGKTSKDKKDVHAFFKKRKEMAIVETIIREKILGEPQTS